MAFDSQVIAELRALAAAEGLDPAALLAVAEVESGGRAFTLVEGRRLPVILYEYHVFWRNLSPARRPEAVRLGLARPRWKDLPYPPTQRARYAQLARAAAIDREAAHAACSWGIGQVLGENARALGYASAVALAEEAMSGVTGQARVMLRFIAANGLGPAMAARDWAGFARIYNGAGQVATYAARLVAAHARHGGAAPPPAAPALRLGAEGPEVAALQRRLAALGHPLVADGDFGPATLHALRRFQTAQGLAPDGIAGAATLARLAAHTADAAVP